MKFRISIPGAFGKFNELVKIGIFKFAKDFDISVYDSLHLSPWNGGRISRLNKIVDLDHSVKLVKIYNSKNIGVFVTFSNYRVDNVTRLEENYFLSILNESSINGVILANDNLKTHIRKTYPNLKISYSVSGFESLNLSPVSKVFEEYDLVCPRYEWTFRPDFYNNFNISKCNIMLNDCCKAGCALWSSHFKAISDANRLGLKDLNKLKSIQECWIATNSNNPSAGWSCNGDVGMNLDLVGIRRLVDIGYIGFKICGRDLPLDEFAEEVTEYLELLCSAR